MQHSILCDGNAKHSPLKCCEQCVGEYNRAQMIHIVCSVCLAGIVQVNRILNIKRIKWAESCKCNA